ncbi:MAG: phosphoribosyltransferase [Candidatus Bathyarchaeia archaeon]
MDYLPVGWEQMYGMCIELAEKIREDGFNPDLIVGVARGGWIPARILSDLLHNPNLTSIRVEFYEDVGVTGREPRITQQLPIPVKGRKVLIVDDVSDTGRSLLIVYEHINKAGAESVKTATLHYKPHSIFKPDFYIEETSAWIIYPHERYEFILSYLKGKAGKGCTVEDLIAEVKGIGLDKPYVERLVAAAWDEYRRGGGV